ncbi:MAG: SAM-dependent chlorinase/fluorinase [Acidimicrobiales bacterium]
MGRFDTISFLSDYGRVDEFVGVVHSVVRQLAPEVRVIDLTHDIPAHDVRAGGLALARSAQYLAPGVVLAVVDPGVGSARRAVAVEVGGGSSYLVGPDNGLLAPAVAMVGGATRAVELAEVEYQLPAPGPTFAGRDVFGPAAAHLCNGVDLLELGPELDVHGLTPGLLPVVREEGDALVAEVLWTDGFGNLQLNIGPDEIEALGDRGAPLRRSGPHGHPPHHLRRHPDGRHRARGRLVRPGVARVRPGLGRRRARHRHRRRGRPRPRRRRRRARRRRHPGRAEGEAVRPATTIVLAVLLGAILLAATLQLVFLT